MSEYRQSDNILDEAERLRLIGLTANAASRDRLGSLATNGFAPNRILDAGCGTGDAFELLHEIFPDASIVGLDQSEDAVHVSQQRGIADDVLVGDIVSATSNKQLQQYGPFDLVYIRNTLLHIKDLDRAVAEMKSQLKENGVLFIQEPDWDFADANWSDFQIFKRSIMSAMMSHGINPTVGKDIKESVSKQGLSDVDSSLYEHKTSAKDEDWLVIKALLEVSKNFITKELKANGVNSVEDMLKLVRTARKNPDSYFDNPAWVIVVGTK